LISSAIIYNEFIALCELLLEKVFPLEKEEKLIDFLTNLLESCNILAQDPLERTNSKDTQTAKTIKLILDENLGTNLTLINIASQVGFSIAHCLRLFKKEYGLPVHAYILNQKVHKANPSLDFKNNNSIKNR
jgi:AraC-like DNA-binding protein